MYDKEEAYKGSSVSLSSGMSGDQAHEQGTVGGE